jgi:hypothetical protein
MAQFDTSTGAMLTHGYNFCKLSDGRCHTGQSQLIYQTPSETCDLVLLKTTTFYEIQGERPRYTAPTALSLPAYTDEKNSTRVENMEYENTPMVLMTPGNQDTLRFVRKGVLRKCNHQVFSTNYDHLFVSTDQVPTAKRSIEATDIKLTQFVTNKMDYLYHSNLALIEDIYRDTILRDCQIKRELLRTQLAFASANPDAATPLLSTHLGIFGRVTGEALFIFKCTPVEVTPRNSTDCTNQLAVTYERRKVYLEPISRIIVNTPTIIECSTITPPRFKMTDNLWLTVPYRIRTETPRTLSVNWPEKEFRFQSLNELSSSGIYSKEDLEKARKHIFFPQTRSRIITEIVQRTTQHYDSFPNYGMLITPDAIYGAASGFLSNLWNRFMWFGQVASGFLGLWILCTLIKSVSSRVISGYELYKILGWSWKMCSCIFPFIAKLLIDKRRDRQVHKLAKTIEELETHVDKENQDICCEVGAQHEEPSAPLTQNQPSKEASSSSEVKSLTPPAYPVLYPRLHQATDLPWMEPWWYSYKPPTQRSSLDEQPSRISLYPSINFMVYYSEDSAPLMDIRVNGIPSTCLIDTGSVCTLISDTLASKCKGPAIPVEIQTKSITGHQLNILYQKKVKMEVEDHTWIQDVKVMKNCPFNVVLGMDGIKRCGLYKILSWLPSTDQPQKKQLRCNAVYVAHTMEIPARSEVVFTARIQAPTSPEVIFEPSTQLEEKYQLPTSTCLCRVINNQVPVRMVNFTHETKVLPAGLLLGEGSEGTILEAGVLPKTEATPKLWIKELYNNIQLRDGGQRNQLKKLFQTYEDVFAAHEFDLGKTSIVRHAIPLEDPTPIKLRPYRIPVALQEECEEQIQKMLKHNIIRRSVSAWSAPVVLVKKKDNSRRFCVDYRRLNSKTVKDVYPLPRIDEMIDKLAQSQYFSALDLASGYWQIEVAECDKPKTAFNTGTGLYEFNVLPFGLTGAPSTFQRTMDFLFMDVGHVMVYIDDLIIFSPTFEEHLKDLEAVFKRLRQAGLKLKPTKCEWAKEEVQFLGHIVSRTGIQPDPTNTNKVKTFPEPKTVRHIQQFLGLASYYRRFIMNFALIAEPLHRLLKKDQKFIWQEDQQRAFETLKEKLVNPPIMVFPNFTKPFWIQTDASGFSIGSILAQKDENQAERVIAYASRTLNKAEKAYSVIERELLAIIWSVKHFRHYIYGQQIMLQTDHSPLKWLMSHQDSSSRLMRWALQLQEYNIQIEYKPGRINRNVDALSRIPHESPIATIMKSMPDKENMKKQQMEDPELKVIVESLEKEGNSGTPSYVLIDDLLHYRDQETNVLVVPRTLREQLMLQYHDASMAGHLSAPKVLAKLKNKYYWSTMRKDVQNWCKACRICASRKRPKKYIKAPLKPLAVEGPFATIAMDIVGPMPKSIAGNKYILVCMDYLTKFPECFAIEDQTADTIARILVEEIICRYGAPKQLLTDRGTNFMSEVMSKVTQIFRIHKINTSAYHPQTDGMVERFNSSLLKMLASYTASNQQDWDLWLPYVLFAYRTAPHSTTKLSPFMLLYGREANHPGDTMFPEPPIQYMEESTYADILPRFLNKAWQIAKDNIQEAQEQYKSRYDRNATPHPFQIGEQLLIHTPQPRKGLSPKLQKLWSGPFTILDVTPQNVLVSPTRMNRQTPQWIHVNRCKPAPIDFELATPNKKLTKIPATNYQLMKQQ